MLRPHAGEEASHVVVLGTLVAAPRRLLRRHRGRDVAPEPPAAAVPITRATIIDAHPLEDERAAAAWLGAAQADGDSHAAAGLAALNRIVRAHRVAVADAGPRDVTRSQALVARLGWGGGEEVAEGRWRAAVELPAPVPGRRNAALRSQERLAALLSGRDAALACEELALRARGDLAVGQLREAALTLRVALEAALAELPPWAARGDLEPRLEELRAARGEIAAAANRALQGGLDDAETAAVQRVLERLEAALRARTAGGFE